MYKGKFGIEDEFFILKGDEAPSHADIRAVLNEVASALGGEIRFDRKRGTLTVGVEERTGYLKIGPDFATTVMEVAYPPHVEFERFEEQWMSIEELIRGICHNHGLKPVRSGIIDTLIPVEAILSKHKRFQWYKNRPNNGRKLFENFFTARSSGLHIHLDRESFSGYDQAFALEYLVPLLFSNSKTEQVHCKRLLLSLENDPMDGTGWGLSTNFTDPNYCYIRPREFGTIEYRSACCQPTLRDIARVLALRFIQHTASINRSSSESKKYFEDCARTGIQPKILGSDLNYIASLANHLPLGLRDNFIALLEAAA